MKGCEKMIINNSMVTESLSSTIMTECELHDVVEEGYKGEIELLRAVIAADTSPVTESGMSVVVEGVLGNFFRKLIDMVKKLFNKVISFFTSFVKSFSKFSNSGTNDASIMRKGTPSDDKDLDLSIYENLLPDKCGNVVGYIDAMLVNLTKALSATRDGIGMLFEKVKDEYMSGIDQVLNGDICYPPPFELDDGIVQGIKNIIASGFNVDVNEPYFVDRCILGKPVTVKLSKHHVDLLAKTSGECTKYCKRVDTRACSNIASDARNKLLDKIRNFDAFVDSQEDRRDIYINDNPDSRDQIKAYERWDKWAEMACFEFYTTTSTLFKIICEGFSQVYNAQNAIVADAICAIYTYYDDPEQNPSNGNDCTRQINIKYDIVIRVSLCHIFLSFKHFLNNLVRKGEVFYVDFQF